MTGRSDKISVIVPIYKVEKYIGKCVESIINQTHSNLEIILVDDGSPDTCGEICDAYAAKDTRVKVIHKENGGLSDARNAGIEVATGDYIGFVDSDDYIHSQMYEKLLGAILEHGADMSICSYECVDEEGEVITRENPIRTEVLSNIAALEKLADPNWWYYTIACDKLYKKKLFDTVRFPKGKIHEDQFTVHELFYACEKIATITDKLYFYLQRNNSIMSTRIGISHLDDIEALCNRSDFYDTHGLNSLQPGLMQVLWSEYIGIVGSVKPNSALEWKRWKQVTKRTKKVYFRWASGISLKNKLHMANPKLYLAAARVKKAFRFFMSLYVITFINYLVP